MKLAAFRTLDTGRVSLRLITCGLMLMLLSCSPLRVDRQVAACDTSSIRRFNELLIDADQTAVAGATYVHPRPGRAAGLRMTRSELSWKTVRMLRYARVPITVAMLSSLAVGMMLCSPIAPKKGRKVSILLYARYSTEEQDASSIPDQYFYCRRFLKGAGVEAYEAEQIADAEISGEHIYRPGIDAVREGIAERKWDLIIVEDSSRLFRNVRPALELVESAVDAGIRVIAVGDDVDTADREHWEDRLTDALSHHARSNKYTSRRIKRKHEALWEAGAALGLLKPGYNRRASIPEQMGEPAKGPFFDEIDEKWREVIHEAYERVARGDPPWLVAQWLTEEGLPKSSNAKSTEWFDFNVIDLMRRTDYRGFQTYRKTVTLKRHATGKRPQVKNDDPESILTRQLESLRIVSDALWFRANAAIDERAAASGKQRQGRDHPLVGVARDSRGPLSKTFCCSSCEGKMWQGGRGKGGYRCAKAKNRNDPCWNKASSKRDLVHENIGRAVADELIASKEHLDVLVDHGQALLQQEASAEKRLNEAQAKVHRLERACQKVADAIENAKDNSHPSPTLVQRLTEREQELVVARAEEEEALAAHDGNQQVQTTREDLEAAIDRAAAKILSMDREAGHLLKQLVGRIEAVPYQQFNSTNVVLRARFTLKVANFLPSQLAPLLQGGDSSEDLIEVVEKPMLVDLFEPSSGPAYGREAFALKQQGLKPQQIADQLGITNRKADIALKYGKAMHEAGVVDPYIELTEKPANAARWR